MSWTCQIFFGSQGLAALPEEAFIMLEQRLRWLLQGKWWWFLRFEYQTWTISKSCHSCCAMVNEFFTRASGLSLNFGSNDSFPSHSFETNHQPSGHFTECQSRKNPTTIPIHICFLEDKVPEDGASTRSTDAAAQLASKLDGCIRGIWNKETYSGVIFRNVQVPSVPAIKFCIALISCYEICMESLYTSSSTWYPVRFLWPSQLQAVQRGLQNDAICVWIRRKCHYPGSSRNTKVAMRAASAASETSEAPLSCQALFATEESVRECLGMTQLRILQISILGLTYHLDLKLNFFYNAIA